MLMGHQFLLGQEKHRVVNMPFTILNNFLESIKHVLKLADSHNGFIQAVSTIVLVFITVRSIKEAENTRKDNRLPIIKLEVQGPMNYKKLNQSIIFRVENIGYGLAIDVKLHLTFDKNKILNFGNVEPDTKNGTSIEITSEELEQMISASKSSIALAVSYEDIFGRKIMTFASLIDENEGTVYSWPVLEISKWRVGLPK